MRCYFKNLIDKDNNSQVLTEQPLPRHIAIIMDGNGRWAKKRGLPRVAGHRAGTETLKEIVEESINLGIPYLTVYAFSTENWKRPREEVNALMGLLVEYIDKELDLLHENGVKIRMLGRSDQLPPEALQSIKKAIAATAENNRLNLQIALNYGGRREIIEAVNAIFEEYRAGKIKTKELTEEMFSNYLYTAGLPDPDLVIRPSGELRLSNFLLWQSAYSEFWVTNVLWPDFNVTEYHRAIRDYQQRHRRYGGL